MRKIALFILLALSLFLLTACEPWEDAVSFVEELRNPETVSEEPESEPEAVMTLPNDAEVRKTLGIVVSGRFSFADESISNWMLEHFPGGDWTVSGDAVDYWVNTEDGEAHFGFTVDRETDSFTMDVCEIGEYTYSEEELKVWD